MIFSYCFSYLGIVSSLVIPGGSSIFFYLVFSSNSRRVSLLKIWRCDSPPPYPIFKEVDTPKVSSVSTWSHDVTERRGLLATLEESVPLRSHLPTLCWCLSFWSRPTVGLKTVVAAVNSSDQLPSINNKYVIHLKKSSLWKFF